MQEKNNLSNLISQYQSLKEPDDKSWKKFISERIFFKNVIYWFKKSFSFLFKIQPQVSKFSSKKLLEYLEQQVPDSWKEKKSEANSSIVENNINAGSEAPAANPSENMNPSNQSNLESNNINKKNNIGKELTSEEKACRIIRQILASPNCQSLILKDGDCLKSLFGILNKASQNLQTQYGHTLVKTRKGFQKKFCFWTNSNNPIYKRFIENDKDNANRFTIVHCIGA